MKESELSTQVRLAEGDHDQTLDTLGRKLEQSILQFEDLDIRLNNPNGNDRSREDTDGNIALQATPPICPILSDSSVSAGSIIKYDKILPI